MNEELTKKVIDLEARLTQTRDSLDLAGLLRKKAELDEKMGKASFWENQEAAQGVVGELKGLTRVLEPLMGLNGRVEELKLLVEMIGEEADPDLEAELAKKAGAVETDLGKFELQTMMNGANDARNAFVTIQAGAGGTESCDWAEMLLRMYTHYFDNHGYSYAMLEITPNEEAGIKSATLDVRGPFAYGYLKAETGVHRLVRISPFDSAKRRHTSFASVDVMPQYDEAEEIEVNEKDIELQFYHSGGAGGQHVNKTASAVRITHIPTGIVVSCQEERSQHKNRRQAMRMLTAKLRRIEEDKRNAETARLYSEKGEIAFGNQIRSYVLQPYQMVKDHRTDVQVGNVEAVLDGDLDRFIEAYLRLRMQTTR